MLKRLEKKFNDFLYLNEGKSKKRTLNEILEAATRHLEAMKPRSMREQGALRSALQEVRAARLESRRLTERLKTLEEQIKVLEEGR
jgi:polyhydroxyalkanoate synthesis regulator phasin